MKKSVRDIYSKFTETFEGSVAWMYLDVKGLVTVAIGNLIDPVQYAVSLPFFKPDGSKATPTEIVAEWKLVKADTSLARAGHLAAKRVTKLRLSPDGINQAVMTKLDLNEQLLLKRFPDWNSWPADAQLATHSIAWACGANFNFPLLAKFLGQMDFTGAVTECHISEVGNPGVKPRNVANKKLYQNAANVMKRGLDPEVLHYPNEVKTSETLIISPPMLFDEPDDEVTAPLVVAVPVPVPEPTSVTVIPPANNLVAVLMGILEFIFKLLKGRK